MSSEPIASVTEARKLVSSRVSSLYIHTGRGISQWQAKFQSKTTMAKQCLKSWLGPIATHLFLSINGYEASQITCRGASVHRKSIPRQVEAIRCSRRDWDSAVVDGRCQPGAPTADRQFTLWLRVEQLYWGSSNMEFPTNSHDCHRWSQSVKGTWNHIIVSYDNWCCSWINSK